MKSNQINKYIYISTCMHVVSYVHVYVYVYTCVRQCRLREASSPKTLVQHSYIVLPNHWYGQLCLCMARVSHSSLQKDSTHICTCSPKSLVWTAVPLHGAHPRWTFLIQWKPPVWMLSLWPTWARRRFMLFLRPTEPNVSHICSHWSLRV